MSDHCEEALHELYGYLDGALTEDRRRQIAAHLDACAPCVDAFDFEVELRVVISQRCREQVSPDLRRRIAEAIGYTGDAL